MASAEQINYVREHGGHMMSSAEIEAMLDRGDVKVTREQLDNP